MKKREIKRWALVDTTIYIASDGTEWGTEETCRIYEEGLKKQKVDGN